MNDRELLEKAAKAAGIDLEWDGPPDQWQPMHYEGKTYHGWNPLEDDGDAFRLMVDRDMKVGVYRANSISPSTSAHTSWGSFAEPHGDDSRRATRRAIVRAAAAMND